MNIGILGSGFIIPHFISAAKANEQCHLRALWARNLEKAKAFEADVDYLTDDLSAFLSDPLLDFVYVGLPNALHYEYALKALEAHKNLIVEKPFTVTLAQAENLFRLANEQGLMIFEAITTCHNPAFLQAKQKLSLCGTIRLIEGNYSQYSSRYQRFKQGVVLPAFDPKMAGGALMDLGIYNIHFVSALFGMPKEVHYFPNIVKGIDTSGVLVLDYGDFKATLVNAKDCTSDCHIHVQGDEGTLSCLTSPNRCNHLTLKTRDGETLQFHDPTTNLNISMVNELADFVDIWSRQDWARYQQFGQQTLLAMAILEKALKSASITYSE